MITVPIYRAQNTGTVHIIKSFSILIDDPIPDFHDLRLQQDFFENEARLLFYALVGSLPGGTLDRLLVMLLQHKASSLIVPLEGGKP